MGNSGLSSHFRVVRALVWVVVGDTAGLQGLGDASGDEAGARTRCVSQVESPRPHFQSHLQG